MVTAKRAGRVNVWPESGLALATAYGDAKVSGRRTVWRTQEDARENMSWNPGSGGFLTLEDDTRLLTEGGKRLRLEDF